MWEAIIGYLAGSIYEFEQTKEKIPKQFVKTLNKGYNKIQKTKSSS